MCEIFVRCYTCKQGDLVESFAIYNELNRVVLHSNRVPFSTPTEVLLLAVSKALRFAVSLGEKDALVWLPISKAYDILEGKCPAPRSLLNCVNEIHDTMIDIDTTFMSANKGTLLRRCPNQPQN